jgi:hypothetical protein
MWFFAVSPVRPLAPSIFFPLHKRRPTGFMTKSCRGHHAKRDAEELKKGNGEDA